MVRLVNTTDTKSDHFSSVRKFILSMSKKILFVKVPQKIKARISLCIFRKWKLLHTFNLILCQIIEMIIIFCIAFFMSYTSVYTVRVYTRKDIFNSDETSNIYLRSQSLLRQIIGSLNLVSLIGIMLWGFINLSWYIPIIIFFALSFLLGIIFGKSRLTLFYRIQPILDTLSFCSLIYLWINQILINHLVC